MSEKRFDLNEEEYVRNQVDYVNNMVLGRNYALLEGLQVNLTGKRHRRITREQIRRALDNPLDNIELLQQASYMLKVTNGIYQEVLDYQANMLTNDYLLIPLNINKIKSSEKIAKALEEMSNFVGRYNIKYNASWIYKRIFEQGELYVYKIETSDGIILMEIPNVFCKITHKENSVHRFAVDLGRFTDKTILYMPDEIQKAYRSYKKNKSNKNKSIVDNSYYKVGKLGVAFPLEENATKGLPYYTSIFDDLIELEDKKDLKSENDIIDAIKLIHQKLPYDKDTGQLLINTKQAQAIHNATKSNLPKGTAIVTHHLETEVLTLSDSNTKLDKSIEQATDNAYNSSGISAELFNGKKNSNQAIVSGIVVDSLVPIHLQQMVANWINYELSINKKSGVQFKLKFIDTTHFNKESRCKLSRENMAYGGSRLEFLATQGYEPNESINLLKAERLLGLDDILVPQSTSYTSSGKTGRSSVSEDDSSKAAEAE